MAGRVKYRRPRYGRTPEDGLWHENRKEDLLRSLGVRFVRVAAADLSATGRAALDRLVRRQLATAGPRTPEFREVPRREGRWRGEDAGHDGRLARTDDGVGARRPG